MKATTRNAALVVLLSVTAGIVSADPPPEMPDQPRPTFTCATENWWNLDWQGVASRTYFIQSSVDLINWDFQPAMAFGEGTWQCAIGSTSDKFFVRLFYADDPTVTSLEQAKAADFDGDGFSNLDEISIYQTNPLNPDTDGDGLPDGWEIAHGLNPNEGADSANIFPGSNLSNLQAFNAGVQANPNATMDNFDGDALTNVNDADPHDGTID